MSMPYGISGTPAMVFPVQLQCAHHPAPHIKSDAARPLPDGDPWLVVYRFLRWRCLNPTRVSRR